MSKLDDFLVLRDVSEIREEIPVKIDGKELSLIVRPLTEREHSDFQNRCYKTVGGKMVMNIPKYRTLMLEACIIEPNFQNPEFLKKVKCSSFDEFINRKFPAGTVSEIAEKIQEISGFETLDMEIENAKN